MDWLTEHLILLFPQGTIALGERALMFQALLFMLMVAVPVYCMVFFFAWRYRAGNKKAKYTPDWAHSNLEELIWWAIPFEIILVLGALTWTSTHELDPRQPLKSDVPPIEIQVVSLNWKWLFIYPGQKIATVNDVRFPVDTPVRFKVTADSPMNSFWIPALGSQVYAMTGMVNTLYLDAHTTGIYSGKGANYTGDGFAKMKFTARAVTQAEFDDWVSQMRFSQISLSNSTYAELSRDSTLEKPLYYSSVDPKLFDTIVMKFMQQ